MSYALVSRLDARERPPLAQFLLPLTGAAVVAAFVLERSDLHHAAITLLVLAIALAVAVYDVRTLIAPNLLTYPGTLIAVGAAFTLGRDPGLQALFGSLVTFLLMLVIAIAGRGRMGMGDVKMAALCGAAVGLRAALPMLLVTFLIGGAIAAGALLFRRRRPGDVMAFTPLLAVATILLTLTSATYLCQ